MKTIIYVLSSVFLINFSAKAESVKKRNNSSHRIEYICPSLSEEHPAITLYELNSQDLILQLELNDGTIENFNLNARNETIKEFRQSLLKTKKYLIGTPGLNKLSIQDLTSMPFFRKSVTMRLFQSTKGLVGSFDGFLSYHENVYLLKNCQRVN